MKTIVITGGTRGIGFNLVKYFLKTSNNVVFCGRTIKSVQNAIDSIGNGYKDNIHGVVANVKNKTEVKNLIDEAINKFGNMDIFIANAGIDQRKELLYKLSSEDISNVVDVNLIGTMNCAIEAIAYYKNLDKGAFYVMEGFGSDGRMTKNMTLYGTTKRAIRYLGQSLAKEVEGSGIIVGNLSPGMVATDFLKKSLVNMKEEERNKTLKMYNILADKPEVVTEFLGREILKNNKNNKKIYWLTTAKILGRFLGSIFRKRDIIK